MHDTADIQWVQEHPRGAVLSMRVHPGARRNSIDASRADMLKVSVVAAPDKGKANKEIVALLAKFLACDKSTVRLLSGQTSREKRFFIEGLSPGDIVDRLRKSKS